MFKFADPDRKIEKKCFWCEYKKLDPYHDIFTNSKLSCLILSKIK